MFATTTDIRRNVAALFFAIVFSSVALAAAVTPANVTAPTTAVA